MFSNPVEQALPPFPLLPGVQWLYSRARAVLQAGLWLGARPATTAFLIVGIVAVVQGLIGSLVERFGEQQLTPTGLALVLVGCLLIPLVSVDRTTSGLCLCCPTRLRHRPSHTITAELVSRRLKRWSRSTCPLQGLQSLGSFRGHR